MAIGIYAKFKSKEIKYSKYIGTGTNNIAELTAIKIALQKLSKYRTHRIKIYTDSRYSVGVLTMGWKVKANKELIDSIKKLLAKFTDLSIEWVKGHNASFGNKAADNLAKAARKKYEKKLKKS